MLTRGLDVLFGLAFGTLVLLLRVRTLAVSASAARASASLTSAAALRDGLVVRVRAISSVSAPMRSALGPRLLDELGGALLGLGADLVGGLARRPQQPRRLGPERVEHLGLVERPRRSELLFERVDRAEQLGLALRV